MDALAGIRVLDLSRLLPGPYCTMLLADFGAEVIKVEEPGRGDYSRSFPPFLKDLGYWHLQLNRNKKSVTLDLKSPAGRQAFLQLAQTADVVVESYRPGVLSRLGVDYATVSRLNPKIVYCSLSGYGKTGPLAGRADHDLGYLSLSGVTAMSGEAGGAPALPGVLMADMNGALAAAVGIMVALRQAALSGQGQEVDVSLYNVAMSLLPGAASLYFGSGFVARRGNNWLTGANPNYNIYATKDGGYLAVGCLEKKFWRNLCLALGRPELVDLIDQEANYPYLKQELAVIFAGKTLAQWQQELAGQDACVTPVLDYDQACAAPQTAAGEMVLEAQDPELGSYKLLGFPIKLSRTPARLRKRAPRLGEDNGEYLGG